MRSWKIRLAEVVGSNPRLMQLESNNSSKFFLLAQLFGLRIGQALFQHVFQISWCYINVSKTQNALTLNKSICNKY